MEIKTYGKASLLQRIRKALTKREGYIFIPFSINLRRNDQNEEEC